MENWVRNEVVYEGKVVRLRVGDAEIHDGSHQPREVVEHPGGVAVTPYHDGKVFLVRQYRIAVDKHVLELPAGRLEGTEDPASRAHAELEEEIGYKAGRLVHVASCYCSPGFCNELDHIYLAFDLTKTEAKPEFDEQIEIVELDLEQIRKGLEQNGFEDMKTVVGLRELLVHLEQEGR